MTHESIHLIKEGKGKVLSFTDYDYNSHGYLNLVLNFTEDNKLNVYTIHDYDPDANMHVGERSFNGHEVFCLNGFDVD